MVSEEYNKALESALTELSVAMNEREALDTKREELDVRISQLTEGAIGLGVLCGMDRRELAARFPELFPDLISPDVGFTDAVRMALASKRTFISPVEVRKRLEMMTYDISQYTNVLASIHTVLKRLVESEEATTGNRDGKVVYCITDKGERTVHAIADKIALNAAEAERIRRINAQSVQRSR